MDIPPKRILLIEPDDALRRTLAEQLSLQMGLIPLCAATTVQALVLLAGHTADAALVAVDDGNDDRNPVPAIRAGGVCGPVMLLVPPSGDVPPGGDDHLVKPVRLSLLMARLRSLLERAHSASAAVMTGGGDGHAIGPYRFLPSAKRLETATGERVRLTEKETQILEHLCGCGGSALREELLAAIWGYTDAINTHTLETHIYRLRRKLGTGQTLLLRVDGGYRLAMEPETV